jgi:hypothetical protein
MSPSRHVGLLDFLSRAACSPDRGLPERAVRETHRVDAWQRGYAEAA